MSGQHEVKVKRHGPVQLIRAVRKQNTQRPTIGAAWRRRAHVGGRGKPRQLVAGQHDRRIVNLALDPATSQIDQSRLAECPAESACVDAHVMVAQHKVDRTLQPSLEQGEKPFCGLAIADTDNRQRMHLRRKP